MSIKCKEGATVVGTFSSAALFDASCFARKWDLDYSLLGHSVHLLVLNISQKSELFIGYLDGDAEKLGVEVLGVEVSSMESLGVILATLGGGVALSLASDAEIEPPQPKGLFLMLATKWGELREAALLRRDLGCEVGAKSR